MRTDLAPARFNWTHRFSQLVLNSDLNVNLEFTRMMTPPPLLSILSCLSISIYLYIYTCICQVLQTLLTSITYTDIHPLGHSRQVGAASVSIRRKKLKYRPSIKKLKYRPSIKSVKVKDKNR